MFLSEVLIEMETLKSKIFQLEKYLKQAIIDNINLYEETITKLFELIDKYRSHLILINKVNNQVNINIGGSSVSLANAILILDALKHKIEIMDSLIDDCKDFEYGTKLMDERNVLSSDFNVIFGQIKSIEWKTTID